MKPLPHVTKKILNADYVQLTWSDINSDSSWKTLKDALNSKPTICISTGWLIKEDKDVQIPFDKGPILARSNLTKLNLGNNWYTDELI